MLLLVSVIFFLENMSPYFMTTRSKRTSFGTRISPVMVTSLTVN